MEEKEILCEVCHKPVDKHNSITLVDGNVIQYYHWSCFYKISKQTTESLSKAIGNFRDAVKNKKVNVKPFELEDKKN